MQVLSGNCFVELEDAVDGPGGMGQHPTPPRLERHGDGIPLTHPASGMGRGWEIDLYNWDGNGVGMAPPKPAPLPILPPFHPAIPQWWRERPEIKIDMQRKPKIKKGGLQYIC